MKLCLIRCIREDRTLIASKLFVKSQIGQKFIDPVTDLISDIYGVSYNTEPIFYLVGVGGDPTTMIIDYGNKIKVKNTVAISMGQG